MTRLRADRPLRRETGAAARGRVIVIEFGVRSLVIRFKGARRGFEVDYESILWLGARKEAERKRLEKASNRRGAKNRR